MQISYGEGPEGPIEVTFTMEEKDGQELRAIFLEQLPQWAELFARKNSEYGDTSSMTLGPRGQFSDMYRKIIKLKRAMWDENESILVSEGMDEILRDLIGHAFLALNMRSLGLR